MMKYKKQIVFLFGCIALISYLSIHFSTPGDTVATVITSEKESTHMQIYLKDKDDLLVPLSIPVNEEAQEEDKLQMMFSYMSGKQNIKGFKALFQKECNLENITIENGIASLYFDDSLKNYREKDELRVLEAITWGTTQFHDIEQVKLYMNDKELNAMPIGATPIPEVLNRGIGINHFETATMDLHSSTSITVFANKRIDGIAYLIPQSRRIKTQGDPLTSSVEAILSDISASSELVQPLYADEIKIKDFKMQDGTLTVELNRNILGSDTSVKQNVYDTLVLSLAALEGIDRVEVKVEGHAVTPQNQNAQAVSKYELNYNRIKF